MEGEFQQSFVKSNGNFGMRSNDVDNTDTILKSNPKGLGCIIKGNIDSRALVT